MNNKYNQAVVTTIKDLCRVCYTCVRECPAKAIRIANGQAEVIAERCIGCGNCVRVCSQHAKKVVSAIEEVEQLLDSGSKVAACVAPSFPADFPDLDYKQFVGMLRSLGFSSVHEVGFGADLVARKMQELFNKNDGKRFISSACPAVFGYVKRYHPNLIDSLAPVVSPMIAMARALRFLNGDDLKIVFIGPCIAKKIETYSEEVANEINETITFVELRQMFLKHASRLDQITPSEFDPPRASKGSLFPIGGGLLEASNIKEDFVEGDVISANGRAIFIDAIVEFSSGEANAKLLDVLCCDGCIMGPGMTTTAPFFKRRARVSRYVRQAIRDNDIKEWFYYMEKLNDLNLSRKFTPFDQRISSPDPVTLKMILVRMGKFKPEDELNCGSCGYDTCREHAIAIHKGLAEGEMCLPYTIERLHKTVNELAVSNEQLASTREALIQSEKMASMGQLSAGIAHEINNPLGVVLMYSHLLLEEAPEEGEQREDLQMIVEHADRAKKIVAGLLNFARQNKSNLKTANIQDVIVNCLNTVPRPTSVKVEVDVQTQNPVAEIDSDQFVQVINNLANNSFTAMPKGGLFKIVIKDGIDKILIEVSDTGMGIPQKIISKVFDPFFTTKEAGKGTGLGLAITYGIIKMHRGDIKIKSNTNPEAGPTGTVITVSLPRKGVK